jgi:uroporphyrinogen III methyltransferase/synthase
MLRPLLGKTVVVTRPRSQAAALCAALEREGATVLAAPLIRVAKPASYARLDAALRRLGDYDAVAFTSSNAVRSFFERLKRLKLGLPGRRPKLYAVGTSTARALALAGWRGAVVPKKHDSRALARRMGTVKGLRVLLPRALRAREELPRLLRGKGAKVDAVTAYRTVKDKTGGRRLRRATGRGIDAVAFTSGSTVERFVGGLSLTVCRRLLRRAAAVSIGPVTSAALRAYGLDAAVQAKQATDRELCRALVRHFTSRRRP